MRIESDNSWPVTNDHVTAAGLPDACCWCKAKLGRQHKPGCVVCQRTVIIDATIRLVCHVTEDRRPDEIEFGMNHGRWCADNILRNFNSLATHGGCLCEFFTARYVREATAEDEDKFGVWMEPERKQQLADTGIGETAAGWKRITEVFALG